MHGFDIRAEDRHIQTPQALACIKATTGAGRWFSLGILSF